MTHTAAQREHFNTITQDVCILLDWSHEAYCAFMEKIGKQYLQLLIPNDPAAIDMLVANKLYWSWWRTNWYQRDVQFVACMLGGDRDCLVDCYKDYHCPQTLRACIYPSGAVLRHTYAEMIQKVIDSKEEAL